MWAWHRQIAERCNALPPETFWKGLWNWTGENVQTNEIFRNRMAHLEQRPGVVEWFEPVVSTNNSLEFSESPAGAVFEEGSLDLLPGRKSGLGRERNVDFEANTKARLAP
jgi:hypothetical protein